MREAFTYMFKDNKLFNKAISIIAYLVVPFILGLMYMITNSQFLAIIAVLAVIFTLFALTGYFISCVKAIALQDLFIVLPNLNPVNNFVSGVKPLFASAVANIAVSLGCAIIIFLSSLTGNKILIILVSLIFLLFVLIYIFLMPAFICIFAKTEKFWSYINFKLAFNLVSKNVKKYLLYVLIYYIPIIIFSILDQMTKQIKDLTLISFFSVYIILCPLFLYLQAYASAKSIDNSKDELI